MKLGMARPGVAHMSFIDPRARLFFGRDFSHHDLLQKKAGARRCGICGRWVIRGMGRWWETR